MDLTQALIQENPAAQDNAIMNLIFQACVTEGWVTFVHHNGETIDIVAGQLTPDLKEKIIAALNNEEASHE